ncbi:MAG: hypothetical protein LUI39_12450 [Lachnospiraceae bacterium]|nr:hypothetical protein [Lachnospiraceae bacterium]
MGVVPVAPMKREAFFTSSALTAAGAACQWQAFSTDRSGSGDGARALIVQWTVLNIQWMFA